MAKTDLITIIDHHTSTKKGICLISLLINDVGQKRSYQNNWSSQIKNKKNIVKITNNLWYRPK